MSLDYKPGSTVDDYIKSINKELGITTGVWEKGFREQAPLGNEVMLYIFASGVLATLTYLRSMGDDPKNSDPFNQEYLNSKLTAPDSMPPPPPPEMPSDLPPVLAASPTGGKGGLKEQLAAKRLTHHTADDTAGEQPQTPHPEEEKSKPKKNVMFPFAGEGAQAQLNAARAAMKKTQVAGQQLKAKTPPAAVTGASFLNVKLRKVGGTTPPAAAPQSDVAKRQEQHIAARVTVAKKPPSPPPKPKQAGAPPVTGKPSGMRKG